MNSQMVINSCIVLNSGYGISASLKSFVSSILYRIFHTDAGIDTAGRKFCEFVKG